MAGSVTRGAFLAMLTLIPLLTLLTVQQPNPPQAPPCNPFIQTCPGANCEQPATAGRVTIFSPNDTVYFYVGQQINITW